MTAMARAPEQLSLKWTFIEVKDAAQAKAKRSSSEPPNKATSLLEDLDPFQQHRAYIMHLCKITQEFRPPTATISTADDSRSDGESCPGDFEDQPDIGGEQDAQQEIGEVVCLPCETSPLPETSDVQGQMGFRSVRRGNNQHLQCKVFGICNCNAGSIGHPEFCNRSCLFFSFGQCSSGMDCNFCHEQHPHRLPHLDKINRTTLKSLPVKDRRNLLLLAMKERSLKELSSEERQLFWNLLRQVFGWSSLDEIFQPTNEGWRDSRLLSSLLRMPLVSLYNSLTECSDADADAAKMAMTRFRLS